MKLQKKHLVILFKAMNEAESSSLAEARLRDSFMKPLTEATATFESDEQKIYSELCVKDEEGKPVLTEQNQWQFEGENAKKVLEERNTLHEEEVELPEVNKEIMVSLIESTNYKFKTGEADQIDAVIDIINGKDKTKETADTKTEESSESDSGESVESEA